MNASRAANRWIRLATFGTVCVLALGGGMTLYLASAWASKYTRPVRHFANLTPAAVGLDYSEMTLRTSDGLSLAAWYVRPVDGRVVIMAHGLAGNRAELLGLAAGLAEHGFGLLMVDLRAHGASQGEVSTLGLREVGDIRAALAFLSRQEGVAADRIGIFGVSLGGATSILAAEQLAELKAVVVDSSFASVQRLIGDQFNAVVSLPSWTAPLVVGIGRFQTGVDPADISPLRAIRNISPRPVFIIHGDEDHLFSIDHGRDLAAAAGPPKELWVVEGAAHAGAYASDPALYRKRVADFFDLNL